MTLSRSLVSFSILCAAAFTVVACGDPDPATTTPDAGGDTHVDHDTGPDSELDATPGTDADTGTESDADEPFEPSIPRTPTQDGVSPDGVADVTEVPGEGQARVGRFGSAETGFEGVWSHCREGDFRLFNAKIDVCIQAESTNRYETFSGGTIVDARRHGQTGEDVLDLVMPRIDLRTTSADRVYVVRDGTDGGDAVLRVEGIDVDLAHLSGVLGRPMFTPGVFKVETEYRLAPDSEAVEIVSWYRKSATSQVVQTIQVGDWFAWGDRARVWTAGHGFGTRSNARTPWVAGVGLGRSYGLVYEGEGATMMGAAAAAGVPWAELSGASFELRPGEIGAFRRWFVIGDGTLDSVARAARALRGEAADVVERTVRVVDTTGAPLSGVGVAVHGDSGALNYGITGEDGELVLDLPAGASLNATLDGLPADGRRDVTLEFGEGDVASVILPQSGRLRVQVAEAGDDTPLTARVEVRNGELRWAGFVVHGELDVPFPADQYRLTVMRGMEYDAQSRDIEIVAGEALDLAFSLVRGVDTEGWISADFHQHMEPSIDSEASVYDRVLDNASQGIELVVPTDHEVVTDLGPVVEKLGLGDVLTTFPGVEISPVQTHINLYPMPYQPDLRGRGSIELARMVDGAVVNRRIPEVIAAARALPHAPIIQLNHARNNSGMFKVARLDPETDPFENTHRDLSLDFDTMEIINRVNDTCQLMLDWSGLLNVGHLVTGIGNSDSHDINARSGVPRSYLRIDSPPGAIPEADVRQTLLASQVTVGTFAFIDFGDAMLPGDLIEAESGDGEAGVVREFHVRVQTPNWAQATRLFAIVNGRIVETIERTAEDGARFDFDERVALTFDEDSWVVFFAWGPNPSGDVSYNIPVLAFTNPVLVDVDGDADEDGNPWEAPGPRSLDLAALNQGDFCR